MNIEPGIAEDISTELQQLFAHLNWTFIFMYSFILYGIEKKKEFTWYNVLMKKNKMLYLLKSWIAGIITAMFFVTCHGSISEHHISTILRSYIIVIVFHSILDNKLDNLDKGS